MNVAHVGLQSIVAGEGTASRLSVPLGKLEVTVDFLLLGSCGFVDLLIELGLVDDFALEGVVFGPTRRRARPPSSSSSCDSSGAASDGARSRSPSAGSNSSVSIWEDFFARVFFLVLWRPFIGRWSPLFGHAHVFPKSRRVDRSALRAARHSSSSAADRGQLGGHGWGRRAALRPAARPAGMARTDAMAPESR